MNILLINQFFWPDSAATSQFLTDVARDLSAHGHEVTVFCGKSRYAPPTSSEAPGVKICRLGQFPFTHGIAARLLSYSSFLASACWHGLRIPKPDLVVTLTTPPLLSTVGTLLKQTRGSQHFIWEMDVYPDVATDLNVIRSGSLIATAVGIVADYSRRRADGIIVLGECMRERLIRRGIPQDQIKVAENWADEGISPLPFCSDGHLTVLYSGNLGLPHDLDTISAAIQVLNSDDRFRFIFGGGGSRRKTLQEFCHKHRLSNVLFQDYVPREELVQALAQGDIGLVTQKAACVGSVVPSKVYGIMAAGRPILFIGPRTATPGRIVDRFRCGWQIDCGDVTGLVFLLKQLAGHPDLLGEAGARARRAFVEHYHPAIGVARIEAILAPQTNGTQKKLQESLYL